jgi:hypothetical protein
MNVKGPGRNALRRVSHVFQETILANREIYSEIHCVFGPNSMFQILFVLLQKHSLRYQMAAETENG